MAQSAERIGLYRWIQPHNDVYTCQISQSSAWTRRWSLRILSWNCFLSLSHQSPSSCAPSTQYNHTCSSFQHCIIHPGFCLPPCDMHIWSRNMCFSRGGFLLSICSQVLSVFSIPTEKWSVKLDYIVVRRKSWRSRENRQSIFVTKSLLESTLNGIRSVVKLG